jgi:CheY-like chemotaxis protein
VIDRSLFIDNFIDNSGSLSGAKAHILIVDDSGIVLRNIKVLLEQSYTVSVAPSGKHALLSIKDQKPDLILLDYEMPEMNGKEVMERIKADETTKDIPVVFLTSVGSKDIVLELLTLEPAGYLLKPVDSKNLHDTINKALRR